MAEMKDLSSSFKRLESDVQIAKTVNNNLIKQLENTGRQCWANTQYSRRECVEVIGIPKTIESNDLEHTVCKVFNSIGFDIEEDRIEAYHRLTNSDRSIVKFSRTKDCQHLMRIKKGLKDLNPTNLSFPEGTKIYVNDSLCTYIGDCGMNARNFGIIRRFIRTLLLMVQLGSNRLRMVHIKASHTSTI